MLSDAQHDSRGAAERLPELVALKTRTQSLERANLLLANAAADCAREAAAVAFGVAIGPSCTRRCRCELGRLAPEPMQRTQRIAHSTIRRRRLACGFQPYRCARHQRLIAAWLQPPHRRLKQIARLQQRARTRSHFGSRHEQQAQKPAKCSVGVRVPHRRKGGGTYLAHQLSGGAGYEWSLLLAELVQHAAEGPHVRLGIVWTVEVHLG
mmetsp:Transcript_72585/g.199022  ORF Transcript_72585/g.199022 Transcript_72585/m.199022 type:complete len:209 (-) Transcript_72585:764-1390(-)